MEKNLFLLGKNKFFPLSVSHGMSLKFLPVITNENNYKSEEPDDEKNQIARIPVQIEKGFFGKDRVKIFGLFRPRRWGLVSFDFTLQKNSLRTLYVSYC